MVQFTFSEDHIRKTNRLMLIGYPFLFLCALGFALFVSDNNLREVLVPLGVIFSIMIPIFEIESLLMNRSLRKMKVLINEDKIIKQCGKHQQVALWDKIIKIKLIQNPEGGLVWIRLYRKNERVIYLSGFDEMDKMASLIREKILDKVLVQTKRYRLDPQSPIILMITCIATMVFLCIIASGGPKAMDIFATLFALIVGTGLLIFRPLTKANINIKWFEIVGALFLIMISVYGFIIFLLTGKLP